MHNKGQGALEYLLLIGGAIVVAIIVMLLLLNVATDSGTQTGALTAASFCTQKAAITNQNCDINTSAAGNTRRVVWVNEECYDCSGNYPQCGASATTDAPYNTAEECQSG